MKSAKNPAHLEGALTGLPPKSLWLRHLRNHWPIYVAGSLSVIATDISEIMIPKIIQWTVDSLTTASVDYKKIFSLLLAVLILQLIGRIFWRQTLGQQTHFVAARFKSLLWNRARFLPRSRLETDLSPGELMNVATGDVGIARFTFGFTWVGTLDFISLICMTLVAMCSIDWKLTLLLVCFMPLLPFLLDKLSRRESAQHKQAQESLSGLTDLAAQAVGTAKLQRLTQTSNFWLRRLSEAAADYRKKRLAVVFTSIDFVPITGMAPLVSFVILLLFGIPRVLNGDITVGAFVALQTYIFIIQVPLFELGTIISEWQRGFSSLRRITQTLGEEEASGLRSGGEASVPQESVYEAKNLSFKFEDSKVPLFSNLNFHLKTGDRLGISGPIGTGKSTLLQVLAGFESRFTGQLSLYGKNIHNYSHISLRQLIAMVPQKPFLFADSVRNNISMSRDYTDDEIWFFLDLAGLREDIENFPDKLNTKLGEWGVNLSGGQKQRMTLARALAAQPKILLLDDCLSAVDTVTEEKILKNLDIHLSATTLVWIAHRDTTLRYCNYKIDLRSPLEDKARRLDP